MKRFLKKCAECWFIFEKSYQDGDDCFDIDECADGEHGCHDFANCTNFDGGFNCTCFEGFYGNGEECVDSDECAETGNDSGVGRSLHYKHIKITLNYLVLNTP